MSGIQGLPLDDILTSLQECVQLCEAVAHDMAVSIFSLVRILNSYAFVLNVASFQLHLLNDLGAVSTHFCSTWQLMLHTSLCINTKVS